tara:strand:- start:3720 stop:3980 length:261 start_codon:yes stop_codon:yes gene_type:complete
MGYVNQTAAYDQKKVRKYGKLYGSIDFEITEISEHYFENNEKPVVGKLHIGNRTFDVTYQELDMIQKTLQIAKDTVNRKHKMGMMR